MEYLGLPPPLCRIELSLPARALAVVFFYGTINVIYTPIIAMSLAAGRSDAKVDNLYVNTALYKH